MLRLASNRKAQVLSEYAILIGIIAAAILSMNVFIKSRTQAIIFDSLSDFGNPEFTEDADPVRLGRSRGSEYVTDATSRSIERGLGRGIETIVSNARVSRSGTILIEEIEPAEEEP